MGLAAPPAACAQAVLGDQVIEQGLARQQRSAKARQAAENVGRSLDDVQALRRQLAGSWRCKSARLKATMTASPD